ncbi:MAG: radical SAM protein [Spirochaetes bacterium]|jgi:nitrogen fixation protein NifB|nr:radical SAM protein [Spirochaetota bacterium]
MTTQKKSHPCFEKNSLEKTGRLHLPVAPLCNIQCGFCNRAFDCVNESRPGVTSAILTPHQALLYTRIMMEKMPYISTIGIAGPGDAFANGEKTIETIELIRNEFPEILFCVSTNGLELPQYIDEIANSGLTHLTITINAVDPAIGAEIYEWIRYDKQSLRGIVAAQQLIENQLEGLKRAVANDITVKINTVVIPGVNDHHVKEIARVTGELGATIQNCMGLIPVAGTHFADTTPPSKIDLLKARGDAEQYIIQMTHCGRCRADAAGLLTSSNSTDTSLLLSSIAELSDNPEKEKTLSAIATEEGLLINKHLGETEEFLIYSTDTEGQVKLTDKRSAPAEGTEGRWENLAEILNDCSDIFVSGAGESPCTVLETQGISVQIVEGMIQDILQSHYSGESLKRFQPSGAFKCGASCSGNGQGCM